jgi:hypothetical protein
MAYLFLVRRIYLSVRFTLFAIVLVACTSLVLCDEPSYREKIHAVHQKLSDLEAKNLRNNGLSPAEQKERFTLVGELTDEDPVWALYHNMIEDLQALGSGRTPEEAAEVTDLRELLPIVAEFSQRATTLPEARAFASILRQFVVRRDVDGAKAWAKAQ